MHHPCQWAAIGELLSGRKNGFLTRCGFFIGPSGSGDGLRAGLSLTRSIIPGIPPENSETRSLALTRDLLREALPVVICISLAKRRGLGLFGSPLDGKLARTPGLGLARLRGGDGLRPLRLGGLGRRRSGLRRIGLR